VLFRSITASVGAELPNLHYAEPAYATEVVAKAIKENGIEAAQYQVALKQVEALAALGNGEGKQTIILPADAVQAFGNAFKMLKGNS